MVPNETPSALTTKLGAEVENNPLVRVLAVAVEAFAHPSKIENGCAGLKKGTLESIPKKFNKNITHQRGGEGNYQVVFRNYIPNGPYQSLALR
jgi:hypothetical protein